VAKHAKRRTAKPYVLLLISVLILALCGGGFVVYQKVHGTTTTTTTIAKEKKQAGWTVISSSKRGVMVDYRLLVIPESQSTTTTSTSSVAPGAEFTVLRMRARTTLLRWHSGTQDPPTTTTLPYDMGPHIDWASEGLAGVVAAFNGGFKKAAKAGGAISDGIALEPLVRGDMTIAINAQGHWEMGPWLAKGFPTKKFRAISFRQNLLPLVLKGVVAPTVTTNPMAWGDPLRHVLTQPRTGLGVDANGNLIFVASMTGVLPSQVGAALVSAGAVSGMELDMNPYWPIMGAASAPLHTQTGKFTLQLKDSQHSAGVFATGWQRDFFTVMAEPDKWTCNWQSPGLGTGTAVVAQPLSPVGTNCKGVVPTPKK